MTIYTSFRQAQKLTFNTSTREGIAPSAVGKLVGLSLVAQLVSLGTVPLISAVAGPAVFGKLGLFVAAITSLGGVAGLRYEPAVVTAKHDESAAAVARGACLLALVISLAAGSLSLIWLSSTGALALFAGAFAVVVHEVNSVSLTREERLGVLGRLQIGAVAVPALLQLGALAAGTRSVDVLVGCFVVGRVIVSLVGVLAVPIHRQKAGARRVLRELRAQRIYPSTHLPYAVLSLLNNRATIFLVAAFATDAQLGFYALAWRLTSGLVTLPTAPLRRVILACSNKPLAVLEETVHLYFRIVGVLLLPGFIWIGFVSYPTEELLSTAWQGLAIFVVAGAIDGFGLAATSWQDRIYDVLGQQRRAVLLEAVGVTFVLAALWASLSLVAVGLAVAIYAVADLAYGFIWLATTWRLASIRPIHVRWLAGFLSVVTLVHGVALMFPASPLVQIIIHSGIEVAALIFAASKIRSWRANWQS